jgi:hypothetical protein
MKIIFKGEVKNLVLNKLSIKEFKISNEKSPKLNFNTCVNWRPVKINASLNAFRLIEIPRRPRRLRRPFKLIRDG